jgi:hypothetical protein
VQRLEPPLVARIPFLASVFAARTTGWRRRLTNDDGGLAGGSDDS